MPYQILRSDFSLLSADELIIVSLCSCSTPYSCPSNNLFGMTMGSDGNISLQFQGQASLFSERSSLVRDTLIHGGDQYTTRSILTTAPLEDIDRQVYRRPDFMFGDAAPDPDHQLHAGEGQ